MTQSLSIALSSTHKEEDKQDDQAIIEPKHYVGGRTIQLYDLLEDWGLDKNHYLACALKYIARAGRKGDEVDDLKKAITYLERRIKVLSQRRDSS